MILVTGRFNFDDEDSVFVFDVPTAEEAVGQFIATVRVANGLEPATCNPDDADEKQETVFVNVVAWSPGPIVIVREA